MKTMGIPGGLVEESVPPPVVLEEDNYDTGVGGWTVYNPCTIVNDNGRVKVSTAQVWGTASKELQLIQGRHYRIRFTLDIGNCQELHIPVYDPASHTFETMPETGIGLTESGMYEGTFTAQVARTLLLFEVIPGVGNPPPDSTAYFWIDNFSNEEYTPPYDLLSRNRWTIVREDDDRIKVISTDPWGEASKMLHLEAGKKYRLRYTVDLGNLDPMHVIVYNPSDGSYVYLPETGLGFHDSGEKMGTFTAAADELELRFQLPLIPAGADSVYCWLDNIYLEEVVAYVAGGGAEGGGGYRYGFNGKEKSDEIHGKGNGYDFGARIYDPRIARFYSIDPMANKYPDMAPYSFAANSPIWLVDRKGKEPDRNQAGTIEQAAGQWTQLKNQTVDGILNYLQTDPNAVRYVYTKDKGWIDLQHYFGTIKYGKTLMDLLEPASGNEFLQNIVFGAGANESYYSYEDLPSNQFASESRNLSVIKEKISVTVDGVRVKEYVTEQKEGKSLINSIKENFVNAGAINPENAPNWQGIPFKDHEERERIPEIKGYQKSWMSVGIPGAGMAIESATPIKYTKTEKKGLLKSGKYIPQNHSSQPYDLTNFPAAPSSLQMGNTKKGNTGH